MWGTRRRLRGRANNSLITGRFHEGGHVCALSCSRNGSMSFLVVPERMPMCFTLSIVSSLWRVPEKRSWIDPRYRVALTGTPAAISLWVYAIFAFIAIHKHYILALPVVEPTRSRQISCSIVHPASQD